MAWQRLPSAEFLPAGVRRHHQRFCRRETSRTAASEVLSARFPRPGGSVGAVRNPDRGAWGLCRHNSHPQSGRPWRGSVGAKPVLSDAFSNTSPRRFCRRCRRDFQWLGRFCRRYPEPVVSARFAVLAAGLGGCVGAISPGLGRLCRRQRGAREECRLCRREPRHRSEIALGRFCRTMGLCRRENQFKHSAPLVTFDCQNCTRHDDCHCEDEVKRVGPKLSRH